VRCNRKIPLLALGLLVGLSACGDAPTAVDGGPLAPDPVVTSIAPASASMAALGQFLFEDENLSVGKNQSCQTCHEPSEGFAAPLVSVTTRGSVVQGSVAGRFGDRKPPTAAYATLTPNFSGGRNPTGGLFWDGRATGQLLGSPAADQALGPFLNPVEQALPDKACVVYRVRHSSYLSSYTDVWRTDITTIDFPSNTESICTNPGLLVGNHVQLSSDDRQKVETAYNNVARSIAAFEATLNRFSAKVDRGGLTSQEDRGRRLFSNKGKCQQCHTNKSENAVFTDFAFHNLGVPKNPANPMYDSNRGWIDTGLLGFTGQARHDGKFRTPTTRNVAVGNNRTYMHNGALVSLLQVVDFYNTRDVLRTCTGAELDDPSRWGSAAFGGLGCWPPPENPANLDTKQMGKLGLSDSDVRSIVAYLCAMTDAELLPNGPECSAR
jgi:cytochrome c peroxidase